MTVLPPKTPMARRYLREFGVRLAVLGLVGGVCLADPQQLDFTKTISLPLLVLWGMVLLSMLSQLSPSSGLTTGCLKQYPVRFAPAPSWDPQALRRAVQIQNQGAVKVALVWLAVNGLFGLLYHLGKLSAPALVLLCAICYVCDLVCVLFFCPFQFFLMKNRCCVNCRIFAWGSWMMAAPLMCVPHWYSWSLFGAGLLVLCVWEVRFHRYPERFWSGSNQNLQCRHCQDQLCQYKWPRRGQ